ncbi:MAG: hypothetical protein ACTTKC_05160 [Treponema sp.]|uniref:SAP domain-containing protein n=1 Tax=Treponema sp. TaxID=166 RepID=UPI003FA26D40
MKYVVANGYSFTGNGRLYDAGEEITDEVFGGNNEAFLAAVGKGMIDMVKEDGEKGAVDKTGAGKKDGGGDTTDKTGAAVGTGQKKIDSLSKKELEDLAKSLNLEASGKKEEVVSAIKTFIGEYLGKAGEVSDEQMREFAALFGLKVEGKTKDELVSALSDLQK